MAVTGLQSIAHNPVTSFTKQHSGYQEERIISSILPGKKSTESTKHDHSE